MEEEARRAGVAERFRFAGWIEYDDMPAYLNAAEAVVMPCEDETLARVYLETMACGRALVASDIDAAREVVDDGRSGLLFRAGDVEHMAAEGVDGGHDPALRDRLGRAARAAMRRHALGPAVDAYAQLFRDVVRGRPGARRSDDVGDVTAVAVEHRRALRRTGPRQPAPANRAAPWPLVRIRDVRPFYRAMNEAAAQVGTDFFLQLDADMIPNDWCVEELRAAMEDDVGMAAGPLWDPLMGTRRRSSSSAPRACARLRFRDTISPDVDFYQRLPEYGWRAAFVLPSAARAVAPTHPGRRSAATSPTTIRRTRTRAFTSSASAIAAGATSAVCGRAMSD